MRFYLDADLPYRIAEIARRQGVDIVSSHEYGRNQLPDEGHLRLAAEAGRCLVTSNRDDFDALTLDFFDRGRPHAGVLIVPHSLPNNRPSAIARALVAYAAARDYDLPPYTVTYLPP